MALDITQVLNTWAEYGVFSYVFPFLIIFAIVFAILQKTKLFGDGSQAGQKNINGVNAIIAVSVAFISLLNDYVATFFATIFPRFGIALAIFLVLLILIGFFIRPDDKGNYPGSVKWIGWFLGLGVVLWAWSEWNNLYGVSTFGVTYFLEEYFWGLVLLGGIGGLIYWIVKKE